MTVDEAIQIIAKYREKLIECEGYVEQVKHSREWILANNRLKAEASLRHILMRHLVEQMGMLCRIEIKRR